MPVLSRPSGTNDDGSGTSGTVLNAAYFTALMDAIDAALAQVLPLAGGTLTGDLKFTDATYDIGKSGATRPRDGFFSRHLTAGGLLTVNGFGTHSLSASGAGSNTLQVVNPASADSASLYVGTNTSVALARIQSYGSTHATTAVTDLLNGSELNQLGAGGLNIVASHASGPIRFYSGGTTLKGAFSPTSSIGLILETANPLGFTAIASATGTTAIIDSGGYLYKQTSSARYKEHLDPWAVTPDALRQFVALAPRLWDYMGQQTGAAGFTAEDLDALPIRNAYGTSPLINYDAEGRPESNRDYALIGLQHLALQQHAARLEAIEATLAKGAR